MQNFNAKRGLGIMLLLCMLLMSSFTKLHAQYVHTQGTQIVDGNGNPIFFRGINLGNWLLWEGYLMMGDFEYRTHTQFFNSIKSAFGDDLGKAIEFEHQWRLNYVNEQAIVDLKNNGFNAVRVPFHFNLFWDYGTYNVTDRGFQYLDRVIEYCRNNGMYVLLDMHAAPGYQNPGDHSDNVNSNSSQPRGSVTFWDGDNVNIASKVWKHIANYYKNEPVVWGYDLINEPVPQGGREYELMPSMVTMRNAIREVDNNHIIVVEGSWWGSDMSKLDWQNGYTQSQTGITAKWDNNLVYQTHHYADSPDALNGRLDVTNRLGIPLMLGEYGENNNTVLRSMTDWCQNHNVSYFPWSFKKMYHDKCLWTINPNSAYNAVRDYIKYGGTPPANAYNNMISFCQNNIGNGVPGFTWHEDFYNAVKYTGSNDDGGGGSGSGAPIGQTIWLKGYNGQYVSSENGTASMMCNRASVGGWELFYVEATSDGKIALKGSNGNYVSNGGGTNPLTCNSTSVSGWEAFTWENLSNGQVALKGFNNQYVSSENGTSPMMCNRSSVSGWEAFTWGVSGSARMGAVNTAAEVSVFPNPINGNRFTIALPTHNAIKTSIKVMDMVGKEVYANTVNLNQIEIQLPSDLKPGVYHLLISNTEIKTDRKIVVK